VAILFASGSAQGTADVTIARNHFLKWLEFKGREPAFVSKSTTVDFEVSLPLPPVAHIHVCLDLWTQTHSLIRALETVALQAVPRKKGRGNTQEMLIGKPQGAIML
jgi:hypothetical protein